MNSLIKELRDAAKACPDHLIAKMAKDIADELHAGVKSFSLMPNGMNLRTVNGAWVRAVNILQKTLPTPTTPPRSGAGEIVEQQRLAA